MTGQTCALSGCFKPPWPSVRQGDSPALACGNLHHQLLMASRFNPALPHPYKAILRRNASGLCALLSCEEAPYLGHSWCSRTHYLLWLTEFTSSLEPEQICMLPSCTRHVFVDDNARPSRFCGWRHQQKFVMLSAVQHRQQESLPSVEPSSQHPPTPASLNESEHGHMPLLHARLHSLKQLALFGIPPKNISVIEDFFEKHPWEVLTEGHACWFIACPKFTIKGRTLTTKGHRWKQSGRQVKKSKYTLKYYTYTKMKGKENEADQQHVESSFNMHEYTMEGIKSHTLIHLVKEKPLFKGKLGKEQPSKQQTADQVDNACSEDTGTWSSGDLEQFVDSLWNDDPLLDDDAFYKGGTTYLARCGWT